MLYANKKFVGEAIKSEADGKLLTQYGEFPVKKGDIVFRPFSGEAEVLTEKLFSERYIHVERISKKPKVNLDEMAGGYVEMGNLIKEDNNENYIFEVKNN